jgi:hypothetical protein
MFPLIPVRMEMLICFVTHHCSDKSRTHYYVHQYRLSNFINQRPSGETDSSSHGQEFYVIN